MSYCHLGLHCSHLQPLMALAGMVVSIVVKASDDGAVRVKRGGGWQWGYQSRVWNNNKNGYVKMKATYKWKWSFFSSFLAHSWVHWKKNEKWKWQKWPKNGYCEQPLCIDWGKEFINKNLIIWCHECGIEIQMTAPNWTYTKSLEMQTPYERRFKKKPNVSHFQEFRTSVWVLLQGQKELRKMQSRLRWWIFMGYNDGSKSIKYHNAETQQNSYLLK